MRLSTVPEVGVAGSVRGVLVCGREPEVIQKRAWGRIMAISPNPTSGAVAEPFGGGQILAQESHSRPPPTGVNGYFRERLPPVGISVTPKIGNSHSACGTRFTILLLDVRSQR
jgi:hypothetical protein